MSKQIAKSADLQERGRAVRFAVIRRGVLHSAIAIRFDGAAYAYLNRCAHLGIELDIRPGDVFSRNGNTLICAAHGAEYHPGSGLCAGGPCFGDPLIPIHVKEENGAILLDDPEYRRADVNM